MLVEGQPLGESGGKAALVERQGKEISLQLTCFCDLVYWGWVHYTFPRSKGLVGKGGWALLVWISERNSDGKNSMCTC